MEAFGGESAWADFTYLASKESAYGGYDKTAQLRPIYPHNLPYAKDNIEHTMNLFNIGKEVSEPNDEKLEPVKPVSNSLI